MDRSKKRVLVTGATGLVGGRLVPSLKERYSGIRTLSRSARGPGPGASTVESLGWDGIDPGPSALAEVQAVIHLAGEPIFGGLPTAKRLASVRESRIESTRRLVDRILEQPAEDRPETLVCASAIGIYGDRDEEALEESVAIGSGFLADVCRGWEAEAERAKEGGVRVVLLRIGVVLASDGGALALMKIPFRMGIGGRLGSGRQFFPWIHIDDLVGVILWCLDEDVEGPVNAVAPEAVRNIDLTQALGSALGRPAVIPVPSFVLRLALGKISGELLGSRRVIPRKLEDARFAFQYRSLRSALEKELG
jgi:uncharacterized protein